MHNDGCAERKLGLLSLRQSLSRRQRPDCSAGWKYAAGLRYSLPSDRGNDHRQGFGAILLLLVNAVTLNPTVVISSLEGSGLWTSVGTMLTSDVMGSPTLLAARARAAELIATVLNFEKENNCKESRVLSEIQDIGRVASLLITICWRTDLPENDNHNQNYKINPFGKLFFCKSFVSITILYLTAYQLNNYKLLVLYGM